MLHSVLIFVCWARFRGPGHLRFGVLKNCKIYRFSNKGTILVIINNKNHDNCQAYKNSEFSSFCNCVEILL